MDDVGGGGGVCSICAAALAKSSASLIEPRVDDDEAAAAAAPLLPLFGPGVDAALLAAAPDDASLGSFLLADVVVVAADSLELEAAPKRMLAMSLGKALKPCSRTGFDSSRDLIWAFSCSICFVSLASSSVKPPWSLERMGAWTAAADSSSENCGSSAEANGGFCCLGFGAAGALSKISTLIFFFAGCLGSVPAAALSSAKALSGS